MFGNTADRTFPIQFLILFLKKSSQPAAPERIFGVDINLFKEQKTVAFYSEKMNLTTYQLNTITKALLGKTPSTLINEYVVLETKRLLLET